MTSRFSFIASCLDLSGRISSQFPTAICAEIDNDAKYPSRMGLPEPAQAGIACDIPLNWRESTMYATTSLRIEIRTEDIRIINNKIPGTQNNEK